MGNSMPTEYIYLGDRAMKASSEVLHNQACIYLVLFHFFLVTFTLALASLLFLASLSLSFSLLHLHLPLFSPCIILHCIISSSILTSSCTPSSHLHLFTHQSPPLTTSISFNLLLYALQSYLFSPSSTLTLPLTYIATTYLHLFLYLLFPSSLFLLPPPPIFLFLAPSPIFILLLFIPPFHIPLLIYILCLHHFIPLLNVACYIQVLSYGSQQ